MGFWASQFYFIQIEFKRKDHLMMCVHHVITFTLLVTGYYFNYSAFGHVILLLMDLPDIFLSLAKSLKYIGFKLICDIIFVIFFIIWILNRHILFGYLLYSVAVHPLNYRDIEWNPAEGVYFTRPIQVFFLIVMGGLELLLIMWFRMILKVVISVINGANADDIRSDDEEEDEVDEKPEANDVKERASSPK
jgi:acyl-CoA-dependent ceramide synthase